MFNRGEILQLGVDLLRCCWPFLYLSTGPVLLRSARIASHTINVSNSFFFFFFFRSLKIEQEWSAVVPHEATGDVVNPWMSRGASGGAGGRDCFEERRGAGEWGRRYGEIDGEMAEDALARAECKEPPPQSALGLSLSLDTHTQIYTHTKRETISICS